MIWLTPRTAAAVFALVAILSPSVVDAALAIHVAFEAEHGHDVEHHHAEPDAPLPGAVHGHNHDADTPTHDHGSSLPEPGHRAPRALSVAWAVGGLAVLPPTDNSWRSPDAVASPSPPTVSTTILRI